MWVMQNVMLGFVFFSCQGTGLALGRESPGDCSDLVYEAELSEQTADGVSGEDVVAMAGGELSAEFTWVDGSSDGQVTVAVEYMGGPVWIMEDHSFEGVTGAVNGRVAQPKTAAFCGNFVEVEVVDSVETSDGSLNEELTTVLQSQPSGGQVDWDAQWIGTMRSKTIEGSLDRSDYLDPSEYHTGLDLVFDVRYGDGTFDGSVQFSGDLTTDGYRGWQYTPVGSWSWE